jgi:hypothetical protein
VHSSHFSIGELPLVLPFGVVLVARMLLFLYFCVATFRDQCCKLGISPDELMEVTTA